MRSHIDNDYIIVPESYKATWEGGWRGERGLLTSASEPKVTECALFAMSCGSTLPPACTGSCTMKVDPTPAPFIHSHLLHRCIFPGRFDAVLFCVLAKRV